MTHCAKCGAELIGSRKFCAACGTPAVDPRSPAASTGLAPVMSGVPAAPSSGSGSNPALYSQPARVGSSPSIQYAPPPPASQVNPFAQTAGPAGSARNSQPAPDYGPPPSMPPELAATTPGMGDPARGKQVSPLAVSHVSSAAHEHLPGGPASSQRRLSAAPGSQPSVSAAAPGAQHAPGAVRGAVAGTESMPSVAAPGAASGASSSEPAAAAAGEVAPVTGRPERTQLMGVFPPYGTAAAAPYAAPQQAQPLYPHVPQQPSMHGAQPGALPPPGYGFGYGPGSRVTVTWSNGQRYPGTVQQVSGTQCLIVFPDGQHHWIDMQYVAPV